MSAQPVFEKPSRDTRYEFRGLIGERVRAAQENGLRAASPSDPAAIPRMPDNDLPPVPRRPAPVASCIDALRLTGDSRVADEIEWIELNGLADTCCTAHAARGIALLWEWAVMRSPRGLALNYFGPCDIHTTLPSGHRVAIAQDTAYPLDGCIAITVQPERPERFELGLRIPRWATAPSVLLGGEPPLTPIPGTYYNIEREWRRGDTVILTLDLPLRVWSGHGALSGQAAVFRGPLLLAADARHNTIALDKLPTIDASHLPKVSYLREVIPVKNRSQATSRRCEAFGRRPDSQSWLALTFEAADGRAIVLTDFLSAGIAGTRYRTWLPAVNLPPSPFWLTDPKDGAEVPPGEIAFRWEAAPGADSYRLLVSARRILGQPVADLRGLRPQMETVQEARVALRLPEGRYYWTVVGSNEHGSIDPANSPFWFTAKP